MKEPTMSKDNDNATSSDPTTSSNNSLEESTTSVISESNDLKMNDTSEGEKSTHHYAEVGFPSPHPIVPPTSGVPVQYSIIGGHLNTMVIYKLEVHIIIHYLTQKHIIVFELL